VVSIGGVVCIEGSLGGSPVMTARTPASPAGRALAPPPNLRERGAMISVSAVGTVRVGEFEWDETKARANVRKHGVTLRRR
jgi:hypothetical protein